MIWQISLMGGMSVSGGILDFLYLVVGGSSTDIVYGATGYALNGNVFTGQNLLQLTEGSAMSFFVDLGYAFGIHEALFSLRKVTTEGSANS